MKNCAENLKRPEYVRGFVEIFAEQSDGTMLRIFGKKNKILDYGRSMFRKVVAGDGGYKIENIYYGDGRPLGSAGSASDWPANRQIIGSYNPFPSYDPPAFINVENPNGSLENIDFLEEDIMNKIKPLAATDELPLYETDDLTAMPAYLRFRTRLHNPILFNTSYGDPQSAASYSYSTEIEGATGTIPTASYMAETIQNTNEQDIAAAYPKGSFDWVVTFESLMPRNCRAFINGQNRPTFIFNEIALGFNPYVNDEDELFYSLIAMRYLPDITKVDGLAIMVRWSLIF